MIDEPKMDTAGLAQIFERSQQQLLAVASRYAGPNAADIVQDAFVFALRHRDGFRHQAHPST
jgi:DNA-directed RNA polymerase specialized sigma24 family protein